MYVNTDTSKEIEREETWVVMTKSKRKEGWKRETRDRVIREQRGEREGNKYKRKRMSTHSHTPCHERFFYKWARSSHNVREIKLWLGAWVSTTLSNHQSLLCVWGHMGGMGKKIFEWFLLWLGKIPSAKKSTIIPL